MSQIPFSLELAERVKIRRHLWFSLISGLNLKVSSQQDLAAGQATSNKFEMLHLDEPIEEIEVDLPQLEDLILVRQNDSLYAEKL